jgi:hypothetical protein
MTALSIQPPFPIFTDTDGQPLENGYVWIGTANQNPITNPITAYWDAALTVTAAQPVRTLNGYPANAGTPARLYVNSDYSIQVQNKNGSVVYSAPAATERLSADLVTFIQAGSGAVTRTAQAKMRDVVSVKDFGAVGDGVADDTAAIQAAMAAANGKGLYFPAGSYLTTSTTFSSLSNMLIFGDGFPSVITVGSAIDAWLFDNTCSNINIDGLTFVGASVATEGKAALRIRAPRSSVKNCYIRNFNNGVLIQDENASDCLIIGNIFKDLIGATSGNGYAAYTIAQRTVISDNHFNTVGRHDVYLSGSIPQGAQYCVVEGNTSVSCGYESIALYAQAVQGSVKGCVVQGNTIKSAGFQAIGVSVNSTDNIIANNYIEAAAQYGIQLEGSTAANTYPLRNVVCDNNVVDCGTQQIRAINASNNIFVGNTTSAVSVTPVSNRGINIDSTGTPSSYPSGNIVGNNTYNNLAGGVYMGSNAGVYFGIAERQEQEEWLTAADGDTTPSVLNTKHLVLSNTGATTVTNFDDAKDGQEITLFFTNGNTTVNQSNAYLAGGVNFTGTANDTLTLIKRGIYWYEKCRSVN